MLRLVAVICYWLGLDFLFYWLNRRTKRVLTFHHVLPTALLPSSEGSCICFSDKMFEQIIDVISRRYQFSNDLFDTSTCTVTFDDGYFNQYDIAWKILHARKIPAILFLAEKLEKSRDALAVDRHIIWTRQVPMSIAEKYFGRSFASRDELWTQAVRPMFAKDGENRGELSINELNKVWPLSKAYKNYNELFLKLRFSGCSSEQLAELRNDGWLICHHTYSHFPVSDLSESEARKEITPPKGMKELPFSFPYGDLGSVSQKDVELAQEVGYPVAFANGVDYSSLTGRFFFPRFMFFTVNKYDIHFQLSGMKYFLKHHRLLPILEKTKK